MKLMLKLGNTFGHSLLQWYLLFSMFLFDDEKKILEKSVLLIGDSN